jgi:hypothetical protein
LFDIVSKTYLAKNSDKNGKIAISAKSAVLLVEIPAGKKIKSRDGKLFVENSIISYK